MIGPASRIPAWRRLGLGAAILLAAACTDEPAGPLGLAPDTGDDASALAMQLTCTVDVRAGSMACDPSSPSGGSGPWMNLIVGSQHQFVRLANDAPSVSDGIWSANVTVQNLTLQPFGTPDGSTPHADGVRVFFVDEPSNGVSIADWDGVGAFTGSDGQKYYEYAGAVLGADGILGQGEVSGSRTWEFELNGATTFRFSVLVSTTVPDPGAHAVSLTRISVGTSHTCGDASDGRIYCWGENDVGQLGDGTMTSSGIPTPVANPEGVTLSNVVAGGLHSCAEGSDGNAYCWGYNTDGQLGDGTTTNRAEPVRVASGSVALSGLTLASNHTCAQGDNGRVYCWGRNWWGQLGNGDTTRTEHLVPSAVVAPPGVTLTNVAAGANMTCAEGSNASLYCWGDHMYGAFNTRTPTALPESVEAPKDVGLTGVTVGVNFLCAIGSDGNAYCKGRNGLGQLGNGSDTDEVASWTMVAAPGVVFTRLAAGSGQACGLSSDGDAYCWGGNDAGQLGDGTTTDRVVPTPVSVPPGVAFDQIETGGYHTCARGTRGDAYCWGEEGLVGNGRFGWDPVPTPTVVAATGGL